MSKITFYIARHGKTLMNTLDMVQGWCDSPLTDEGVKVAEFLGKGLKDIKFRTAYCSDLRRTLQSAKTVLKAKGQEDIPIVEKYGFREACFGSYEAGPNPTMWGHAALFLQFTSLAKMDEAIKQKTVNFRQILEVVKKLDTMGIAEDFTDLEKRTQEVLKEIAKEESKKGDANILVISHGMAILGMLDSLGGDKLLKAPLDNAAVCKVIYEKGQFTVESMGDMSYVEKGAKL